MKPKINIWAEKHNKNDSTGNFCAFYQLVDRWIKNYPDIEFERKVYLPFSERKNIDSYKLEDRKLIHNGWNYVFYFIIENEQTRKYFLVSYWDTTINVHVEFSKYDMHNMVEFFSGQGGHNPSINFRPYEDFKYTPLNKVPWFRDCENQIEKLMSLKDNIKNNRIINDRLRFNIGNPYSFRSYLIGDTRFDSSYGIRLSEKEHINSLNNHWINMDLYSISGPSMRLIEGMGLGTAVLSPNFPQKHHTEIIPNYHYVEVPFDKPNLDYSNYQELADSYIATFEELKKDSDRIYFIGKNAREYYLENCTTEKHTDNLYNLLDLNKLM